jgi:four helix bundle protein
MQTIADRTFQFAIHIVALKAARETLYWLKLLAATNILSESRLTSIAQEAEEITRILGTTIVKAKGKSVTEKTD